MSETIRPVNGLEQYVDDYTLYAIYVARYRVMADVRDGLKPVNRKILTSTFKLNIINSRAKSARIVGDVMGNYHPHGDSGIYGAMKPMINKFEIKEPLLIKQGNWGNKYGDEAAAMRYTETGINEFAYDCFIKDLKLWPSCVDWVPNFDNSTTEPDYLPAALPILLINGSFGIGVGLKVEIPKHNIVEVIDATINLIKDPTSPVVLIPDHCMPCEIIDGNFEEISNMGFGSYTVRGIVSDRISNGYPIIEIESAPDLTYYSSIEEAIKKMIVDKKLINVVELTQLATTYQIKLKPGSDVNYVKQMLFQHTDLQQNCRVNFEVLDCGTPIRMSYKSYLLFYIACRRDTKFRIYQKKLQDANTKIHELEPFIKIYSSSNFNSIIDMISGKRISEDEIIEYLIKEADITDIQAKFIINLRLKNLTVNFFEAKMQEYDQRIVERNGILAAITNDDIMDQEIVEELIYFRQKYYEPRLCKVISVAEATGIPQGEFKVVVTQNNFLKKLPVADSLGSFRNDSPKFIIKGDNAENLIFFNEMGKVFKLPIHKISFCDKKSNGIDIRMILKNCTSNINAVMYEPMIKKFMEKVSKYFLVTVTEGGYIKKMDLDDFLSANNSGIIYAKLDDGDIVKDIMIVNQFADIVVYSNNGALRFSMEDVPHLKRSTKGNKAIGNDDKIDGLSIVKNDTTDIIVVTKKGYINRFPAAGLPRSNRGKKLSKVIKLTRGDHILALYGLNEKDSIVVTSTNGKMQLNVAEIPLGSSISGGTKMVPTKGDEIVSCNFIRNK